MADVTDLQEFNRFVQLIANLTAQEINFSELGREKHIKHQIVTRLQIPIDAKM